MAKVARPPRQEPHGRRHPAAGRHPYYAGGDTQKIHRCGPVYASRTVTDDSYITRKELLLGVLLGTATAIGVTGLLLIILLT